MAVDVLFPYYGDVDLMKIAIRSVLAQDYQDFRLIVVDDGYPDDSVPGWFASIDDPRLSYERNEQNLGANGNYRKCLTKVENELVVVMGADDIMMPNYLTWLVERAEEYPGVDIFQPGVFVIDERGAASNTLVERVKVLYRPKGQGVRILEGEKAATSVLRGNYLYFPSIGWRADAIVGTGFREGYNVVQDLALALDILMAGGSLLLDDQVSFQYRRHSGSDSSWRALEGTRFAEEHEYFDRIADELQALGWNKAARVARWHVSSRLHAATLLPKALIKNNKVGVRNLSQHMIRR